LLICPINESGWLLEIVHSEAERWKGPGRNLFRKEEPMKKVKEIVKILHIDRNWKITYVIIRKGILMKSRVSLEATLAMVKKDLFDLILSEPQNLAILKA
jgi:hypothetical protein